MTIKKVVARAKKASMSYGEWVAQNDPPKAKQPPKPQANMKLCPVCRGWFPERYRGKIYCSDECRTIKNNRMKAERKKEVIK